ncbi:nicotinate-nucleotide adenylyltransferase [Dethiosulfatarculus sandiegensis]|uniref:Probable nicotinate-nucleotide adenylyltransferase n=1 Tax=Dethiosulfatarculus sandiegensis TaxID=1429043 RepID=A0A0D2G8Y5_9BACT|nr:nicotinate-nucleotide adenylyltransferase [Dethiosulfatarculus sandiegensis]KIX11362.1 nicotinate-nucleotide adenylyltransferase [Dethiosulfatarculus sandiegensis]
MRERLAIFGGTFDPVHNAHLRAGLEAAEELGLDKVLFMPCAEPPHNKHLGANVEHRLEMLRLAVADNPRFEVCDIEARMGGKSYTGRTLAEIQKQHPRAKIYFLIGADAFFYLHTWHYPMRLFEMVDFVVMARPKSPKSELLEYMQEKLDPGFQQNEDGWVRLPGGHGARRVPTTLLSISSTGIKFRAANGLSLAYLVHPAVEDYIKRMKLYQKKKAAK